MMNRESEKVRKQAQQWYVRMRSSDASDEEKNEHSAWLSRDTSHIEAYNSIERELQDLDSLESWAFKEMHQLEEQNILPGKNRNFVLGLAGMVTAALTVIVYFVTFPLLSQVEKTKYETMKGEQRKIILSDGSRIHLNSASTVEVNITANIREVNLVKGEGLFDVLHDRSRQFVVKVRDSKIIAVGTRFNVYYKDSDIDITVLEGKVAVLQKHIPIKAANSDMKGGSGILLDPDRQVSVNEQGEVREVKVVDATKLTAWNRGLLILDGMPLRDVALEISRYIIGNIKVADDVPDYPVTGVIKIRDQETMLQLLSEVVPVTPVRQ